MNNISYLQTSLSKMFSNGMTPSKHAFNTSSSVFISQIVYNIHKSQVNLKDLKKDIMLYYFTKPALEFLNKYAYNVYWFYALVTNVQIEEGQEQITADNLSYSLLKLRNSMDVIIPKKLWSRSKLVLELQPGDIDALGILNVSEFQTRALLAGLLLYCEENKVFILNPLFKY